MRNYTQVANIVFIIMYVTAVLFAVLLFLGVWKEIKGAGLKGKEAWEVLKPSVIQVLSMIGVLIVGHLFVLLLLSDF